MIAEGAFGISREIFCHPWIKSSPTRKIDRQPPSMTKEPTKNNSSKTLSLLSIALNKSRHPSLLTMIDDGLYKNVALHPEIWWRDGVGILDFQVNRNRNAIRKDWLAIRWSMETDLRLHCDQKLVTFSFTKGKVRTTSYCPVHFGSSFSVWFRSVFSFAGEEHDSRYPETRTEMYSFQLFREQPNQTTIFRGTKKRKKESVVDRVLEDLLEEWNCDASRTMIWTTTSADDTFKVWDHDG